MSLRANLRTAFQEREGTIDAMLAAAVIGEHVVSFGPPGTGKSAIANCMCGAIGGASYFEWLLTRFTEPNELFGAIDLPKWTAGGGYSREMDGMLPTAHIAFLDEIFKSNSSVLNALLSILNERRFFDRGKRVDVPLRTLVAASNELPEGPELEALYDRFLVRLNVDYVKLLASFEAILTGPNPSVPVALTLDELDACAIEVKRVPLADGLVKAMFDMRTEIAAEGIQVSDRRWKKLVNLLRAHAWLLGDSEVDTIHFEVLKHALWRDPREMAKVNTVVTKSASPVLVDASTIFDAIMEQVNGGTVADAALAKEVKTARGKLDALKSDASAAVCTRIDAMIASLDTKRDEIKARVMAGL